MKICQLFCFALLLTQHFLNAQDIADTSSYSKELCIYTGYGAWKNHFGEVGIGIGTFRNVSHHPFSWLCHFGSEVQIKQNGFIGPKLGAYLAGGAAGLALGLQTIYYTNFKISTLSIRPEIGIGVWRLKLAYGYNFFLYNRDIRLESHRVSIGFAWGIADIK